MIIEVKTALDDLGGLERQISWYERMAWQAARQFGWKPQRTVSIVLGLASEDLERVVRVHREVLAVGFPVRATTIATLVSRPATAITGRGFALIDPASRRRDWLLRTSLDGRRSRLPYRDYAAAAAHPA